MIGKGGHFTRETLAKMKHLAAGGMSSQQIADALGCSVSGVKAALLRQGVRRGRPAWSAREISAAKALADKGESVRAAAAAMTARFGRKITVGMLTNRARRDGYKFAAPPSKFNARAWTPAEDAYLRRILGPSAPSGRGALTRKAALRMMKAEFSAPLSEYTLASRAAALGLSFAPKGERQTGGSVKARGAVNPAMLAAAKARTAPDRIERRGEKLKPGPVRGAPVILRGAVLLEAAQDPVGCRYIYGDVSDGDWRYCQRPTGDGDSYCADHHAACSNGLPASSLRRGPAERQAA